MDTKGRSAWPRASLCTGRSRSTSPATSADTGTVDTPIQLAFAEYCHATVLPEVAAGLGEAGSRDVATSIIADSGHWVAEEQPAKVAAAINRFIAST